MLIYMYTYMYMYMYMIPWSHFFLSFCASIYIKTCTLYMYICTVCNTMQFLELSFLIYSFYNNLHYTFNLTLHYLYNGPKSKESSFKVLSPVYTQYILHHSKEILHCLCVLNVYLLNEGIQTHTSSATYLCCIGQ